MINIKTINEFFGTINESEESIELVKDFFIDLEDDFDCEVKVTSLKWGVDTGIGNNFIPHLISGAIGIIERDVISPNLVFKIMKYVERRIGLPKSLPIYIEDIRPDDIKLIRKYLNKTYIRVEFKYSLTDKLKIKPIFNSYLDRLIKSGYIKVSWDEKTNYTNLYFLKND